MSAPDSPPPSYSSPLHSPSFLEPRPSPARRRTRSKSILDELLPLPSSIPSSEGRQARKRTDLLYAGPTDILPYPVLRRIASVGIVGIFLVVTVFLASTTAGLAPSSATGAAKGLSKVFGYGWETSLNGSGQDVGTETAEDDVAATKGGKGHKGEEEEDISKIDFERYLMLKTVSADKLPVHEPGKRVIFIGDVHGSAVPLEHLMSRLAYNPAADTLIHVGDLVAKGTHNDRVLNWMRERGILGVRGNHDQPVVQWRAWMEWAGRRGWEQWVDDLDEGTDDDDAVVSVLKKQERMYPKEWEWKGEHWKIARGMSSENYKYLLSLPLVLHLPSLHSFVVHAGLLALSPLLAASDPSQPLPAAAANFTSAFDQLAPDQTSALRTAEELALLRDVSLNQAPWTLINMRSILTKGKHKGEPTKSAKKGTPWSEVWKREMGRCTGPGSELEAEAEAGAGAAGGAGAQYGQEGEDVDVDAETDEEGEVDETDSAPDQASRRRAVLQARKPSRMPCAPVSVVYGHAAGRGLDIKPFSKGIDTGCVYGRQLTALVLGDTSGLKGEPVALAGHEGLLVSVGCKKGGL